jgi:hypothetical protein
MAIFLIIYIIFVIIWLIWSLISTYHLVKYRFPKTRVENYLLTYWLTAAFIILVSIIYISRANWTAVPLLK